MRTSSHVRRIILIVLLGISGAAFAGGSSSSSSSFDPPPCSEITFTNCLNGVASSVSNGAGLRIDLGQSGEAANERTKQKQQQANAGSAGQSGVAAGDLGGGFGLWASYSHSNFDSDFVFAPANASLAYSARSQSALAGFDALLAERFLLGFALGVQDLESNTKFNGGGVETDGWIFSPYGALIINDNFSIDLAGGFSDLEYDQDRISPTDGTRTLASFDADRTFVSSNLNAIWLSGDWVFGGRFGVLYTEEEQDAYSETGSAASAAGGTLRNVAEREIDLTQLVVGADVAYSFGAIEPYGIVLYRNDLSRDDGEAAGGLPGNFTSVQPDDDDEVLVGFGVRYFSNFGITGSLEYTLVEGRDDFKNSTFMLTVRGEL